MPNSYYRRNIIRTNALPFDRRRFQLLKTGAGVTKPLRRYPIVR